MNKVTIKSRAGTTTRRRWHLAIGAAVSAGTLLYPTIAAQAAVPTALPRSCDLNIDTGVLRCGTDLQHSRTSLGQSSTSDAAPTYPLVVLYKDSNYNGGTLTLRSTVKCDTDPDTDVRWAKFPSGWNDEVSSFRAYSNCTAKLFENANFNRDQAGSSFGPGRFVGYVGDAFNDKASSLTLY